MDTLSEAAAPQAAAPLPRPVTTAEEVLKWPAVVLTDAQRHAYFKDGCLLLPSFISADWILRLSAVVKDLIEKSRAFDRGDPSIPTVGASLEKHFILAKGHCAERPQLTRITSPIELHETFWEFATGPIADIAQDLLGPDVRLHHSKLNLKMGGSEGTKVQWHQDIQFWPHTNYTLLTIGIYLQDVDDDIGPMDVVPLSAFDKLHPLEDTDGNWTGVLSEHALKEVPLDKAVRMKGPAGTVSVHNARCVHGGGENNTTRHCLLLLHTFAAAAAHPLQFGTNTLHQKSKFGMPMVRGKATNLAVFDARPCPMAPNFEAGYKPPFFTKDKLAEEAENPLLDG